MRRNGDRGLVGGDREILDRGYGFHRTGDRWLPDRWLGMPGGVVVVPPPTGLVDGDPVTTWPDSSTNGNNATQTGTARPTFKTNILNGKPVVRFTVAGLSGLNLATPISGTDPWTIFVVFKPTTPANDVYLIGGLGGPAIFTTAGAGGSIIVQGEQSYHNTTYVSNGLSNAFHVASTTSIDLNTQPLWVDGTSMPQGGAYVASTGTFSALGYLPRTTVFYGDCDIAEIIFYSGTVALRAKLVLLLTALITTGELPGPAELDAMVGHRDKIKKYLHKHGAHPTKAQLDAVVTPMAVGDRANIEKYLGVKYGITVAGGTAVQPDSVAGLEGWWKADSLAASTGPPPSSLLTGLVSYWKMDDYSGTRGDRHGTNNPRPGSLRKCYQQPIP